MGRAIVNMFNKQTGNAHRTLDEMGLPFESREISFLKILGVDKHFLVFKYCKHLNQYEIIRIARDKSEKRSSMSNVSTLAVIVTTRNHATIGGYQLNLEQEFHDLRDLQGYFLNLHETNCRYQLSLRLGLNEKKKYFERKEKRHKPFLTHQKMHEVQYHNSDSTFSHNIPAWLRYESEVETEVCIKQILTGQTFYETKPADSRTWYLAHSPLYQLRDYSGTRPVEIVSVRDELKFGDTFS
ncbi:hypothetical protein FF38_06202 [Lucilia cuprina]|uniref:Uncharacterized protein n=1 Tax=Lucilia cuprina TaxID=7375 RepID=A0A0L0CFV7_LUCCU|nr:hypothetical protein FF38_06202 [Lucilia cuprina]